MRILGRGLYQWRLHPSSCLATVDIGQKLGGAVPFFWGSWVPIERKIAWPRPTSTPSGILVHPAVWPQQTLVEHWELCPFRGGAAGSPSNTLLLSLRPTSVPSGFLVQMFGHNTHGPKIGGLCPILGRGAGSPFNTKSPGPRPSSIPSGILIHPAILATTDMDRKLGAVPLWGGGVGK